VRVGVLKTDGVASDMDGSWEGVNMSLAGGGREWVASNSVKTLQSGQESVAVLIVCYSGDRQRIAYP